jgi:hypothetical protein
MLVVVHRSFVGAFVDYVCQSAHVATIRVRRDLDDVQR